MKRLIIVSLGLFVILTACGTSDSTQDADDVIPVTGPEETEVPTLQPVATSTEASILHLTQPNELPAERSSHIGDHDSSLTADDKHAPNGDRFTFGRYERPFNADTMDVYFPELDIIGLYLYLDEDWIYAVIELKGFDSNGNLPGKYGIEFDLDLDGRGDVLVLVFQPASSEWTTDGVRVYYDLDQSVGGLKALVSDYDDPGDGYEELIFDEGMGADPDLAWARVTTGSVFVEIAIKHTAINDDDRYMLNGWAGTDELDPVLFDINDLLTHEQAGAANRDFEFFYPIKKPLSEIDNTCRMVVGFEPVGTEIGLCPIFIPKGLGGSSVCQNPGNCQAGWNQNTCSCNSLEFD